LILQMGISLDGFVARRGPYGAGGWGGPPEDSELTQWKLEWIGGVAFHLMGRTTYEEMAGFWPASDDAYAAPMNEIPKVVFSRTLQTAEWPESRIASGGLAQEIADLKSEAGEADLLAWGGAAFASSLAAQNLIDEYRLVRQPVALGDGLALFDGLAAPTAYELVESVTYRSGEILSIYRPAA